MKIINIKKLLIKVLETTPVGKIDLYAGAITQSVSSNKITTNAPNGWLLCDGSVLLVADYPKLAAVLKSTYGGNGTTTFGLPDFRGRTPVGVGTATGATGATAHTLAQKNGEETHKLVIGEVPNVTGSFYTRGYHNTSSSTTRQAISHNPAGAFTQKGPSETGSTANGFNATSSASDLGSSQVVFNNGGGNGYHNNMPPYLGINYIIYTGVTR